MQVRKKPMGKYEKNDLLREAREGRGWTREELAKEMGTGEQTVKSWENGNRNPGLRYRTHLCQIFGMTAAQLGLDPQGSKNPRQKEGQAESTLPAHGEPEQDAPQQPRPEEERGTDTILAHDEPEQDAPQQPRHEEGERGGTLPSHDPNRRRMLKRVHTRWINGVLDYSKTWCEGAPISVRLQECPSAVINPWSEVAQESNFPSRALAQGTSILDVYDEADGGLLILGSPGAGKTTQLLELARELLARAHLEETHPLPVVFNLTSWALTRSELMVWLVDELNNKYQVPHSLAQAWVSTNQILPLLDGLDEVAEEYRAESVQAINRYRREHGFVSLVVCSRSSEYLRLSSRLALNNAVTLEPLSWEEIENYVSAAGESLQRVHIALKSDPGLREMASTPLMLHIIAQTFRVTSLEEILSVQDEAKRRAMIFEKYVDIVLKRRGPANRYSPEQMIHWLSWLARHLQRHNQTEFYLERMQQDWLPDTSRSQYHHTLFRIIYGIETAAIAGLFAWLRGGKVGDVTGVSIGILGWLGAGPGNSVLGWMAKGLGGGLEGGGMLGIIFVLAVFLTTIIIDSYSEPSENSSWKSIQKGMASGLKNALISGGITAIGVGPLFLRASQGNFNYSLPRAIGAGLYSAMIFGLTTLLSTILRPPEKKSPTTRRKWTSRLLDGISIGAWAGFGFGIVTVLEEGPSSAAWLYTAIVSIASVFFGIIGGEDLIRIGEIKTAETVAWSWQNVRQHIALDIAKGATIGLSLTILIFLILSLASGLFYGPEYGIFYGIIYGIITGLIVGIVSLLTTVLNRGWESSMLSQDQLVEPNEGIRRSLRHSIFAGFLFGPIGGLASGGVSGVAFGLIGRLPGWLLLSIGLSIVFTLILTLQFALIRGGIACIEHYILRWFLWRKTRAPLHYIQFLEFATERILLRRIGGGYMFSHHLLLEYFAGLESEETK